ncbi:desert hedgehog protein B [Nephila pilipes]|uniref:Hedgehog protein n=1 Tax=Nephila pilipes TaxID=299642 RepID=A0A8X6MMP0_NEPPI|nr:desert hedgehog protein B [Nephila pilipes]
MLQQKTHRIFNRPFSILKKHTFFVLCLTLFSAGVYACSPGRSGARRRSIRKLTPLVFKQHVPNIPENSLGASGHSEERIRKGDARFKELVLNYNADIVYKDKRGTGADRVMTQRCKEKLDNLAISVMNQWPSVRLRVTEGFDEDGYHAPESLHYSGRAVDITTSDRDTSKYGMLARLAVEAGFDWVYFESRSHIHCSVKKESTVPNKNTGCFHGSSAVMTRDGYKKMKDLKVGDKVASNLEVSGVLAFSKVIAFLHQDDNMDVTFVRLETVNGNILFLTLRHLIFIRGDKNPKAIYAMFLKKGDLIYTSSVTDQIMLAEITNVSYLNMKGVYAPLTESGTIIVDGIWVSCYAEVTSHDLVHALFFPVRFLHVIKTLMLSVYKVVWEALDFVMWGTLNWIANIVRLEDESIVDEGIHWYPTLLCGIVSPYFVICE